MELLLSKGALKTLRRLQPRLTEAMIAEMEAIAADPFAPHPHASRLAGTKSSYRLRHGDWRILYRVDRAQQLVVVEAVKPRGEAYKR
jgi:mRNA interferase RelE/StbE